MKEQTVASAAPTTPSLRRKVLFSIFAITFIAWTIFIYRFSANTLVAALGNTNSYLISLVLAFFGGISTFITIPYHFVVYTLGAGGLNPWLLGIATATGVFLGDSTSYVLGYHGRDIFPRRFQLLLRKVHEWSEAWPQWLVYLAIFLYGSLAPFSNDFIVISLGLARYPYKKVMIPLGLGNIVFNTTVAFAGAKQIHLFWLS